jgi:hypothetical protein
MQTLVYINPLKAGKLNEYKAFTAENLGPRKKEYIDLLKRYGLITVKVYYHKLGGKEFVIVIHDAEDDATERLANFPTSRHSYDRWFFEQLGKLHDFDSLEGEALAELLLTFDTSNT